jgi:hypothetical protein
MTVDEIRQLRRASKRAASKKVNIWSTFSEELRFDARLLYRRPSRGGSPMLQPTRDHGPVMMPKVFRRLAACHAVLGDVGPSEMASYVETHGRGDWWYPTSEFLHQGITASRPHRLAEVLRCGRLAKRPDQLVFGEQASRVVDGQGRAIGAWVT